MRIPMHRTSATHAVPVCLLWISTLLFSQDVPPIVSTEWLAQNLSHPKMVVVDIRNEDQYKKGHIPGAIHAPYDRWAVNSSDLAMELPSDESLRDLLGKLGIQKDSIVVVINRFDSEFSRADATRVAWTCIVAGVENAAVLDGGYNRWLKENKRVSTDAPIPKPVQFSAQINRSVVVSKRDVLHRIGKSIIVDTRTPEDYFGITSKPGHITSAVNLPTPWAYDAEGQFRSPEDLEAMARGVIGSDKSKEVIIYCGVGGYASTWWILLTQMLGYRNVKLYDGSIQEWMKDPDAPCTSYSWH